MAAKHRIESEFASLGIARMLIAALLMTSPLPAIAASADAPHTGNPNCPRQGRYDPCAVYLAYPEHPLMKMEDLNLVIDVDGPRKGITRVAPAGSKVAVAMDWTDKEACLDLMTRILTGPTTPASSLSENRKPGGAKQSHKESR